MRWRPVALVPHTRQFLVGPSPRLVNADWVAREIGPGLWLSHCPRLPVAEGPEGLVLGVAVGADRGLQPEQWSGRWVEVRGGILRLDACGTLGVFYADGWASSSPALLDGEREAPLIEEPGVMNWYPPPHSGKRGVSRLLPSQTLDLRTSRVGRRPLLTDPPADPAQLLVDAASRLAGPLWLPLTAGVDSRTLLAVAAAAGLDVTTYTFVGEHTPEADRNLPPRLAAAVGFRHRAIRWQAQIPALLAAFDLHTAGHHLRGPRQQIGRGLWDHIPANATVMGGSCFEVGRLFYHRSLPQDAGDAASMAESVLRRLRGHAAGVREWAMWVEAGPEPMDWRDRLYLEQRIAGWLSSAVQGVDITGRCEVHLANNTAFISGMLAMPASERAGGAHQRAIIRRLAPELDEFPVNPKHASPPKRRWRFGGFRGLG